MTGYLESIFSGTETFLGNDVHDIIHTYCYVFVVSLLLRMNWIYFLGFQETRLKLVYLRGFPCTQ